MALHCCLRSGTAPEQPFKCVREQAGQRVGEGAEGSLSDFVVSGAAIQLEGSVPLRCGGALLARSESAVSGTALVPEGRHCSKVALRVCNRG